MINSIYFLAQVASYAPKFETVKDQTLFVVTKSTNSVLPYVSDKLSTVYLHNEAYFTYYIWSKQLFSTISVNSSLWENSRGHVFSQIKPPARLIQVSYGLRPKGSSHIINWYVPLWIFLATDFLKDIGIRREWSTEKISEGVIFFQFFMNFQKNFFDKPIRKILR